MNIDCDKAQQISDEIGATLSEILPDLEQLLQHYQASEILTIVLEPEFLDDATTGACTCCYVVGIGLQCGSSYRPRTSGGAMGLDPEKTEQFCKEVESKLLKVLPRLTQSASQTSENFAVRLLIDPDNASAGQQAMCGWIDGNLHCSTS